MKKDFNECKCTLINWNTTWTDLSVNLSNDVERAYIFNIYSSLFNQISNNILAQIQTSLTEVK